MKKNNTTKSILYLGWVFAFILLWLNVCESNKIDNKKTLIIPEVKGSFEPEKDIVHNNIDTVYLDKIIKTKDEKLINDISSLYNENEALKQAYINETDSLKRELMYLKSIQLNEFYHTFDNDTINIMVKGIVQGEVKSLQPLYTIKERKINIKEVKFRLLGGVGVGNSIKFDKPIFNAGIGFQNKKGNIILGSFDSEKRIQVFYYQSIFSIKK